MKKIAVFCALPPDRNTGMATVDLAAFSVLKRLAPDAEITLYAYGKAGDRSYPAGYLPFHYLDVTQHHEAYFASDIFIFWGDFIHTWSYWKIDRGIQDEYAAKLPPQEQQAWLSQQFDIYSKYIFLTQLPKARLKDVIVYGSTIITNDANAVADKQYYDSFTQFFSQVSAVYFRDAISAARISPLRGNEASFGCDCALLLQNDDLKQIKNFIPAKEQKGVGVFFGRSPAKGRMMIFSRLVARELGEKCSWLQWFAWGWGGPRKERWPYLIYGFIIRAKDEDTGELLSKLSSYKYIVTDTYHLCINAWRMGIPAICIGEGTLMASHSLSDKKKEVLFEMYDARQYYVYGESLRSLRGIWKEAKNAAQVLKNDTLKEVVKTTLRSHQDMALKRLGDALRKLL